MTTLSWKNKINLKLLFFTMYKVYVLIILYYHTLFNYFIRVVFNQQKLLKPMYGFNFNFAMVSHTKSCISTNFWLNQLI